MGLCEFPCLQYSSCPVLCSCRVYKAFVWGGKDVRVLDGTCVHLGEHPDITFDIVQVSLRVIAQVLGDGDPECARALPSHKVLLHSGCDCAPLAHASTVPQEEARPLLLRCTSKTTAQSLSHRRRVLISSSIGYFAFLQRSRLCVRVQVMVWAKMTCL